MNILEAIESLDLKKCTKQFNINTKFEIESLNGKKYLKLDEETELSSALIFDEWEIAKALLANGFNVNTENQKGDTALITALENEIYEPYAFDCFYKTLYDNAALKLVINSGADVDVFRHSGDTALTFAIIHGRYDLVKLLIEADADVNLEDKYGKTPMFRAICRNDYDIIKLLYESNAQFNDEEIEDQEDSALLDNWNKVFNEKLNEAFLAKSSTRKSTDIL